MNPGKRLIRNTVFGMWGVAALFIGWNKLYSSTLDKDGKGTTRLTFGLRHNTEPKPNPQIDLASARDFTRLSVRGPINVEVVGAATFKVTFTPAPGQSPDLKAWLGDGTLRINAGEEGDTLRGDLRVEVPTLTRLDVAAPRFTLRGLTAEELALASYWKSEARLEQNHVGRWRMFSPEPLDLQVDDATFAAGVLRANGEISIRRAP